MSRAKTARGRGSPQLPSLRVSKAEERWAKNQAKAYPSMAAWQRARLFQGYAVPSYEIRARFPGSCLDPYAELRARHERLGCAVDAVNCPRLHPP